MKTREEGIINVPGGNIWYQLTGNKKGTPLIVLHGGPGYPHDSLESLEDLSSGRQVIFYDQLGCGNSKRTKDPSLWTVEHFVRELQLVVKTLNLTKYHILGHSWGSALAVSFALTKPQGLKSLILSDPYIGTPQWEKDAKRLLGKMPMNMQKALADGKYKTKEYKDAREEFYYRHVYRFKKFPVACLRANNKANGNLYRYMWGPEEFEASGTLKKFDLVPSLKTIKVPVLLLCGKYDEATPEALEVYKSLLPNGRIHVFGKSAHMPHWTERKAYMAIVSKFLASLY